MEGAHTNLFAVTADGALVTPPLDRGAVAGLARTLAMERVPEAVEADVKRADLANLRELIAVNAVRGARPVVRVDSAPIGDGRPGPGCARLAQALAS